jgi:hypothetical protein
MRTGLLSFLFVCVLAGSAQAQACNKTPPPFLPELFPQSVSGLPLEFSTAPGGGCMALYRPADDAARRTMLWASVSAETEPDARLGESAEGVSLWLSGSAGTSIVMVDDWPVGFSVKSTGDEFLTVRGSVRIKVSVKNGDHGDASRLLAVPLIRQMLAKVPCG